MIKGNYGESYQQSINELFATELHRKQKFENFTVYTPTLLTVEGGIEGLGCLSYDFLLRKSGMYQCMGIIAISQA